MVSYTPYQLSIEFSFFLTISNTGEFSFMYPHSLYGYKGAIGINKMMQKAKKKMIETLKMGTHLKVLSESYPMNTNMTG